MVHLEEVLFKRTFRGRGQLHLRDLAHLDGIVVAFEIAVAREHLQVPEGMRWTYFLFAVTHRVWVACLPRRLGFRVTSERLGLQACRRSAGRLDA